MVEFSPVTTFSSGTRRGRTTTVAKRRRPTRSDPVGHHPRVQLQEERLELAQRAFLLLLLLVLVPTFLVHAVVLPLLVLLFVHPGDPGAAVLAWIRPSVVGREINGHGGPVVVGESGEQLLDHIGSLVRQVLPLARVGRDVEQPHAFVGGVPVWRQDVPFEVPPAAGEAGENLGVKG